MEALSTERDHGHSRSSDHFSSFTDPRYSARGRPSSPTNHRLNSSSLCRPSMATDTCRYNRRFGGLAQNCTQPCNYKKQEN
jgi:hypothetical protein